MSRLGILAMLLVPALLGVARERTRVTGLEVVPDVESMTVLVKMHAYADHDRKANFRVQLGKGQKAERVVLTEGDNVLNMRMPLDARTQLWSEWNPELNVLKAQLDGIGKEEVEFGMREYGMQDGRVLVNGMPTMLLGVRDTDLEQVRDSLQTGEQWGRVMSWMRDLGLNYFHFTEWLPIEDAFVAADSTGIYIQVDGADEEYRQQMGSHPSLMDLEPHLWQPRRKGGKVIDGDCLLKETVTQALGTSGYDGMAYMLFSPEGEDEASSPLWEAMLDRVTPLALMPKTEWKRGETLECELCVANFSPRDVTEDLTVCLSGEAVQFDFVSKGLVAEKGSTSERVRFRCPLVTVLRACTLELSLKYGKYENVYQVRVE